MRRYVVLYLAPRTVAERFAQATPEQASQGMQLWADWAQRLGPALVELGKPLGGPVRITADGVGPSDSTVIGMSVLQAEDMAAAVALTRDHHHLHWAEGCEIVVLEEQPIPELADR